MSSYSTILIVLLGWIPVSASLFTFMHPVRALTTACLAGWLLLPAFKIQVDGFWDLDKVLATNVGVALGTALFCTRRLRGFKITTADLVLALFFVGVCITSVVNDLGIRDGLSSASHKFIIFGIPFWLGRMFVRTKSDLLVVAQAIVVGAAAYSLLAVWEWRMSPQIHTKLYGGFQHSFSQHARWGFYRPIVCFPHALGLGMFMSWTSLLAISLYRAGVLPRPMGIPPVAIVMLLLLGLLTSMSLGPWGLFVLGLGVMLYWRGPRSRWLCRVPIILAISWMAGRYTGITDGAFLTSAAEIVSQDRAASLDYRIRAESLLLARAHERPIFGWGGYGRNRVTTEAGHSVVAPDGLWIILAGTYGLFGLLSFYVWWCWPLILTGGISRMLELEPVVTAILVVIGLQAINLLFNAFLSPVLTMLCGSTVSVIGRLALDSRAQQQRLRAGLLLASQPHYSERVV